MSATAANAFVLVAIGLVFLAGPLGVALTARFGAGPVLCAGLINMMRGGSSNTSQKLMRWRVGLQFVAILVVMIVLYFRG